MHSSFIVHVIKAVFLELQYFLITMLQHTSIKLILISLLSLSYKTWGKKLIDKCTSALLYSCISEVGSTVVMVIQLETLSHI